MNPLHHIQLQSLLLRSTFRVVVVIVKMNKWGVGLTYRHIHIFTRESATVRHIMASFRAPAPLVPCRHDRTGRRESPVHFPDSSCKSKLNFGL